MLRKELREEDIPHRTTIRARIIQVWEEHLEELSKGFEVCFIIYSLDGI